MGILIEYLKVLFDGEALTLERLDNMLDGGEITLEEYNYIINT